MVLSSAFLFALLLVTVISLLFYSYRRSGNGMEIVLVFLLGLVIVCGGITLMIATFDFLHPSDKKPFTFMAFLLMFIFTGFYFSVYQAIVFAVVRLIAAFFTASRILHILGAVLLGIGALVLTFVFTLFASHTKDWVLAVFNTLGFLSAFLFGLWGIPRLQVLKEA
ncbi:hypothetical protein QNI19_18660 [Cytophagaceae bacterium DM2B3-1]|uniref:Uncharacterized protein n=1 Tax=Xanthocytophaga flava TaxID=3048013 RepID=A0ABT7CMQ6_9BACT|nr:hypothetical protein [Xanthocytophaga flavus]MDJ1494967.1 hypothetical protein [Xanthocytophaga flavus]